MSRSKATHQATRRMPRLGATRPRALAAAASLVGALLIPIGPAMAQDVPLEPAGDGPALAQVGPLGIAGRTGPDGWSGISRSSMASA
jgi:hypothetical protein